MTAAKGGPSFDIVSKSAVTALAKYVDEIKVMSNEFMLNLHIVNCFISTIKYCCLNACYMLS